MKPFLWTFGLMHGISMALLGQSTGSPSPDEFAALDAQWRAEAIRIYPDAGIRGTPLFAGIVNMVAKVKGDNAPIWNLPDRAFLITLKVANDLGISPTTHDPVFEHEAAKAQIAQRAQDKIAQDQENQRLKNRQASPAASGPPAGDFSQLAPMAVIPEVRVRQNEEIEVRSPRRNPRAAMTGGAIEDGVINSVSDNGEVMTLDDGSIWEVSPVDQGEAALWSQFSDVVILNDSDDEKLK